MVLISSIEMVFAVPDIEIFIWTCQHIKITA